MLRACGISAFLTGAPRGPASHRSVRCSSASAAPDAARPATASIKCVPDDFVVVELDTAGQRTDANEYTFPPVCASPSSSSPADAVCEDTEHEDVAAELLNGADVEARHPSVRRLGDVLATHAPALRQHFGGAADVAARVASTMAPDSLSQLSHDVGAAPSSSSSPPSPWWATTTYTLSCGGDREERRLVHLLVRRCFPHLRSTSDAPVPPLESATDGDDAAVAITCMFDLHYIFFCATLGPEAAQCIARWSVEAQAARHERRLGSAVCAELHRLCDAVASGTDTADAAHRAASPQRLCHASFATLTAVMRQSPSTAAAAAAAPLVTEKDVRRRVHELLRRFYPFVQCQVREGHVTLRYRPRPDGADTGVGTRRSRVEAEDGPDSSTAPAPLSAAAYVHLIVRKRSLDTSEMRLLLAEYCGVKDSAVCVAGMKDKRAVTVQRCSVPATAAAGSSGAAQRRLAALVADTAGSDPPTLRWPSDPHESYVVLHHASVSTAPVGLGQLSGNWFSLRVRNVRWATAAECASWTALPATMTKSTTVVPPLPAAADPVDDPVDDPVAGGEVAVEGAQQQEQSSLRRHIEERLARCAREGFVNYFGQQRFAETVESVDDHTGVHLFAGRWVAAVRSLYRACPDVYSAFPDKMEARFVPSSARDAQVMTHALRQTRRMCFSEYALSSADVQGESAVWTRLCEKAITVGVPFYLRSLWVHAGQSAFFNVAASHVVTTALAAESAASTAPPTMVALPRNILEAAQLPLGGYHVDRHVEDGASGVLWAEWKAAAVAHALRELRWTAADAFEQRRVAGVPVPGSWRAVVARPTDLALDWVTPSVDAAVVSAGCDGGGGADGSASLTMQLSFALPPSCYATVFLREVLGSDQWW
ncbi:tRNA pseudouridine synthase D (TruD) [Novymonas esmeraldas]|uniref:tRNA pseudouridine synthase D (TruD) n=1 Tax=Novymonas esmeraldas TaxID=1808958 RepID=A0AAW0EQ36_9TRYP